MINLAWCVLPLSEHESTDYITARAPAIVITTVYISTDSACFRFSVFLTIPHDYVSSFISAVYPQDNVCDYICLQQR